MKYFSDKKVRVVLYLLLIVFADFFNDGGASGFLVVFFQAICAILLLWTLYSMVVDRYRKIEDQVMGKFGRFIVRFFAPYANKMNKRAYRNSNYVVGIDSFQFVGRDRHRAKKRKRKQQKIDFSATDDKTEKIRLSYVKYILSESEKGKDFTTADTPYEIDNKLNLDTDKILFDSYVNVRYGENSLIDNCTVEKCIEISSNAKCFTKSSK